MPRKCKDCGSSRTRVDYGIGANARGRVASKVTSPHWMKSKQTATRKGSSRR